MEIKTTKVYSLLNDAVQQGKKIVAFQGGTRASKTYNILIWLVLQALTTKKRKVISIVRSTLPALRASAERDFFEILQNMGLYREDRHNKTERTYRLRETLFEFFSCDNEQKVQGRKRDILFMNEAIELSYKKYQQLVLRTNELVILDYNPSEYHHWIYDYVLSRSDCAFHILTYRDNPFLPKSVVREIELMQHTDPIAWRVFGLGERGASVAFVFPNYEIVEPVEMNRGGELVYGIDFGYNSPTAVVAVRLSSEANIVSEKLYSRGLTNTELIAELKKLAIPSWATLYCDSAEPDRIEELRRAGFRAEKARKDTKAGIIAVKDKPLWVTQDSRNLIAELKTYKYKQDVDGKILDEVVKLNDHAIDAMRYAIHSATGPIARGTTVQTKIKMPI
jgi:phage terminase large subunit